MRYGKVSAVVFIVGLLTSTKVLANDNQPSVVAAEPSGALAPTTRKLVNSLELDGIAKFFGVPCPRGTDASLGRCENMDQTRASDPNAPRRVIYEKRTARQVYFKVIFFDADQKKCPTVQSTFDWPGLSQTIVYDMADDEGISLVAGSKSKRTGVRIQLYASGQCIKYIEATDMN